MPWWCNRHFKDVLLEMLSPSANDRGISVRDWLYLIYQMSQGQQSINLKLPPYCSNSPKMVRADHVVLSCEAKRRLKVLLPHHILQTYYIYIEV